MTKFFSNKDISKLFRSVAAAYSVKGGEYFKMIAYDKAADSIEHSTVEMKDLWDDKKLGTVPGLGAGLQSHIDELFTSGRVKHLEMLLKGLPSGMFEFLDIPGMGPKSAYKLAKELKLKNLEDLIKAAKAGKISKLPGFGAKSEKEILASISRQLNRPNRYLLPFAFETAQRLLAYLRSFKECERAEPLGSLRRMVATVGDIDIAVASKIPKKIIESFKSYREVQKILGAGPMASSVILNNSMQADLKVLSLDAFGSLLQHFTGSKNHNIRLREFALKKGMSLSEHGIKYKGKIKEFAHEHEFYRFLDLNWIEPELREDTGEIEASINGTLPNLVELEDIKGDIHLHSNYPIEPSHDLGRESFQEIIDKAQSLNYGYIGLSDHSPSLSTHSKKQIAELIKKRKERIEQLRDSNKDIGILNLLEMDILTNGTLSVPEECFQLLDGTIAGIHSSHGQPKAIITRRLLNAIESPYVQIVSHPTNRLLMQRESSDIEWDKVFEACQRTGTILEINAWPNRLDLPDTLVKEAISKGVKLIINTDSHAIDQMDNMRYGVSVARRGWAQKKDIVNTMPWIEFKKIFSLKK